MTVDYAGEVFVVESSELLTVGRNGDIAIEDNPFLHRLLLELAVRDGFWWLANVGSRIAVNVEDGSRLTSSTLAPGARLPLVFPRSVVTFTAGGTTYELVMDQVIPGASDKPLDAVVPGDTTIGNTHFTETQLLAVLALAEPLLRHHGEAVSSVRSAVEAAHRLGWAQTRFNRKLDNVCDKLDRIGVSGLKGGPGTQAAMRRIRLVEYALGSLLVTRDHLPMLEAEVARNRSTGSRGEQP
ncbi:MAG: hypothetical protein CSA84_00845 [Actinomycetales bacterium]|nr:MAG: hypothetical protein CSA84_00845 [Actinomycetales bacterium]